MREGIHPPYLETTFVCSCGERFTTHSTAGGEVHVELCSKCHPFYTGTQKLVDTGGRVQRFADKFGEAAQAVIDRESTEKELRRKAAEEAAAKAKQDREAKIAEKAERAAKFEEATPRKVKAEVAEAVAEEPAAEAEAAVEEPVAEEVAVVDEPAVEAEEPAEQPAEEPAE